MAQDKTDLYFGKNADLEGGFFGPNAEEMAGKFLAEDNSLFGVFAAKRDKGSNEKTERIIDDYRYDSTTLTMSEGDNFGDARQLFVGGKLFPLLPKKQSADIKVPFAFSETHDMGNERSLQIFACCSNLDYLKFGSYQISSNGQKAPAVYFLQGERTPSEKVPTSGSSVRYQGSWQAHIQSQDGHVFSESPNNKAGGSRAVFEVDFAKKTLNGTLTAENRIEPTFTVSALLSGNGFTGTAKTSEKGFVLDPGSTGKETRVHLNADVKGGFYGPDAAELGGIFHSKADSQDKVGGSFGAKRQAQTVQP